ncbi:MAG: GspH/FimT family pseudopilin [Acidobacteria bacterium]|nr:GspH/FimT family pseudopilin [Acidobacteriota bacterium]
MTWRSPAFGYSLVDLLFGVGLAITLSSIAVPQILPEVDDARAAGAARYIAGRLQQARMEAVRRSATVALHFVAAGQGFSYGVYVDGNGNGVRIREIATGVDRRLGSLERLGDQFTGVDFGTLPGLPPVEPGSPPPGNDPVRLGVSNLASFSAVGTATSGSLYIRGRRNAQYVVRLFGDTGKTRILKFDARSRRWQPL